MRYLKIIIFYLLITVIVTVIFFKYIITIPTKISQTTAGPDSVTTNYIVKADTANPLYIHTNNIMPQDIVSYAQQFIGVPYVYASSNPDVGFDCSGFISFVFSHFNIKVPRSSVEFTNVPYEVVIDSARPADLILFTGTDSTNRTVGHMGIVIYNQGSELLFIHSSSGKANGVTITPFNEYYKNRFVKVIRIFKQNEMAS